MAQLPIFSSTSRFCLFCYKTTDSSLETTGRSEVIKKFVKNLTRFIETREADSLLIRNDSLEKLCAVQNLVTYCIRCRKSIEQFCEKYNQLKILELELDWMLDKLIGKINHANKVPSRWVQINDTLEERFQNDTENKLAIRKGIRDFRQDVVKAVQYRKLRIQPRVSLKRHEHDDTSDTALDFNGFKKSKIKDKKDGLEDTSVDLIESTSIPDDRDDTEGDNHNGDDGDQLPFTDNVADDIASNKDFDIESVEEVKNNTAFADPPVQVKVESTAVDDANDDGDNLMDISPTTALYSSTENETENDTTFCCEFCKKPFVGVTQLTKHIVDNLCPEYKAVNANIKNPMLSDDDKICPQCGKHLKTNFALKRHMEWHKSPEEWKWKCEVCGKKFHAKNNLQQHSKIHTKSQKKLLESENRDERNETENVSNDEADKSGVPAMPIEAVTIKEEPTVLFSNFEETDTMDTEDNGDTEYWWDNASTVSSSVKYIDSKTKFTSERKPRPPPRSRESVSALPKPVYECEVCKKPHKYLLHKQNHFKACHDLEGKHESTETFKCVIEDCAAYFLKKSQLYKHYNRDHKVSPPSEPPKDLTYKEHKCSKCKSTIIGKKEFLEHLRLSRKTSCKWLKTKQTYKCKYCGEKFPTIGELSRHYGTEHESQTENNKTKKRIARRKAMENCGNEEGDLDEDKRTEERQKVGEIGESDTNVFEMAAEFAGDTLAELEDLD